MIQFDYSRSLAMKLLIAADESDRYALILLVVLPLPYLNLFLASQGFFEDKTYCLRDILLVNDAIKNLQAVRQVLHTLCKQILRRKVRLSTALDTH